jgi:hypothetical protein
VIGDFGGAAGDRGGAAGDAEDDGDVLVTRRRAIGWLVRCVCVVWIVDFVVRGV